MTEVVLQRASIVAIVRKLVPAGVPVALGKDSVVAIRAQRYGGAQVIARPLAGNDVLPFFRRKQK